MLRDLNIPAISARNCEVWPVMRQYLRLPPPCPDLASGVGQFEMVNSGRLGKAPNETCAGTPVPLPSQVFLVLLAGFPQFPHHHLVGIVAVSQCLDAGTAIMSTCFRQDRPEERNQLIPGPGFALTSRITPAAISLPHPF